MMKRRIFISSTQRDLARERKAIVKMVADDPQLSRFFSTFAFEHCSAQGLEPPVFDVDARHVSVTVIRPTFDEKGQQVGQKTAEVGQKPITNRSEPITNRSEPITNQPEPITNVSLVLPADFDKRMASNRKDLRERAKVIWLRVAMDSNVTVRELSQDCGFSLASTQGALNALKECGLLIKTGATRNGKWRAVFAPGGVL